MDAFDAALLFLQAVLIIASYIVTRQACALLQPARKYHFESTVQALYATFACTVTLGIIALVVILLLVSEDTIVQEVRRDHTDWYHAAILFGLVASGQAGVKLWAMWKWVEAARLRSASDRRRQEEWERTGREVAK
jgi:hypothetical protein